VWSNQLKSFMISVTLQDLIMGFAVERDVTLADVIEMFRSIFRAIINISFKILCLQAMFNVSYFMIVIIFIY